MNTDYELYKVYTRYSETASSISLYYNGEWFGFYNDKNQYNKHIEILYFDVSNNVSIIWIFLLRRIKSYNRRYVIERMIYSNTMLK